MLNKTIKKNLARFLLSLIKTYTAKIKTDTKNAKKLNKDVTDKKIALNTSDQNLFFR